ncbi:hypothetical protein NQ314_010781 [Rhamnusium bicolor]|uniref:F-box domain-containing protein n=1 Tax=Rhamnusium bicolor TaxID=1586634 RepID=A0AAV8XP31_9CUCU|nr:hypothetical protein NQ314_010781 [Rhamnusium bicolor]
MILPVEIIEQILSKCDGKTLLTARKVDDEWKTIVDYLTQKTHIWEWCCREEIPKNELIEYLQCYKEEDNEKWLHIYINWCSWENINQIICDIVLSPAEVPRISCIAVSGDIIAVGSQDGRLRIFTSQWKMLYAARILAVKITSLTFINSEAGDNGLDLCLVVSYNKGLHIFCFDGVNKNQLVIQDVKSHSIYKNYICYEKVGGRMTIAKLTNVDGNRELTEIWFSRIYSPSSLSCMKMWEGVCTFLINNEVKIIEYESSEVTPMDIMKKKTRIKFNFPLVDSQNTQILRNDVIISLCKNDDDIKCDFIEFFILGRNDKYSKKMFNTWEIFRFIYTTCPAGKTWIYEYSHKLIIGKHPIICIDVKETPAERKFYVSSKFNIHEISGFFAKYIHIKVFFHYLVNYYMYICIDVFFL